MKKRKFSIKVWFPVLALLVLGALDLVLDLGRAKRTSGIAVIAVVGLAIAEFAWDTFTSFKQAVEEDKREGTDLPEGNTPITDAAAAALRKLDEMKAAGLIDEKEYRDRKAKLAGK